MSELKDFRHDNEPPLCINEWGWRYHHIGIPTEMIMDGEKYLPQFRLYTSGFSTSPFGIEWMRFEKESQIDILIQKVPHIAFEVDDLDFELANRGFRILTMPNAPSDGLRVAMIEHNGTPIELMEFTGNDGCH